MKQIIALAIMTISTITSAADYYLNSESGSDTNSGTEKHSPFKTIAALNQITFKPGDNIHIAPGTEYHGTVQLKDSGTEQQPIRLFTEAGGAKAIFHGNGANETILLHNAQYWEISNIAITNKGPERVKHQVGLRILLRDFGVAEHIYINNVNISDVYGSLEKETEGHGILAQNVSGPKNIKSRFNDLRIENCKLTRTDRNGICMQSSFIDRKKNWFASTNVIIRGNVIEDCGGDAIKPWGCDGALVEHNLVNGCRMRCQDYAAGIWPWSCDNTIIQFNEVCNTKGTKDGQGFDSDYNCQNTIIQYNYSHDNEGGFLLVCGPKISDANIGCLNTVVRFNISQNDGIDSSRIFHISGSSVNNTRIYNNIIYRDKQHNVPMVIYGDWDGYAQNTHFGNNIFFVEGQCSYQLQGGINTIFDNNLYFGRHENMPPDKAAIIADPLFIKPGSGTTGLHTLDGYKLRPDSPARNTGKKIENIGPRDFFNNPIESNSKISIGAEISR